MWRSVWVVAVLAVLAAAGYVAHGFLARNGHFDLRRIQMTRLTENGRVAGVAITPDGRYVAYARREGNDESLWLRELATRTDSQLLPSGPGFHGLTFSP